MGCLLFERGREEESIVDEEMNFIVDRRELRLYFLGRGSLLGVKREWGREPEDTDEGRTAAGESRQGSHPG